MIMANTKGTQNKATRSGTAQKTNTSGSSRSTSSKKSKKSSDDTKKFLLVLGIVGIVIALIFISRNKEKQQTGTTITGTPAPTATIAPEPTATDVPTPTIMQEPSENTPTSEPTKEPAIELEHTPEPTATSTPTPTVTSTPTPTPTPVLSVEEAEKLVCEKVDTSKYNVQLVNATLRVGKDNYYQFGAIANQEFVYPFLVVDQATGILSCYDSTAETVFDFTTFPIQEAVSPKPEPTKAPVGNLTAKEAYEVLCTYSKEALHIAKAVSEYEAEYGNELTLIDGKDCYRINLSEFSNGKKRNRGEFYVSVDGERCYYINSDTNEFIQAEK